MTDPITLLVVGTIALIIMGIVNLLLALFLCCVFRLPKAPIMDLQNLITNIQDCDACSLNSTCEAKVIFRVNQHFKPYHLVLFVGEAPGSTEAVIKEPFVGRSGHLLEIALREAGIKKKQYVLTNAVLCPPYSSPQRDYLRTPTKQEMYSCSKNLKNIFDYVRPIRVVALGKVASDALTHIGVNHYALSHPAAILRAGGESSTDYARFVLKLKLLKKELDNA